jgi:hypothetical protein
MALIARPHLPRSSSAPALASAALFVAAAALAVALSTVHVPSSAVQGLPIDWAQRSAWLVVQALIGLGVASALMTLAGRRAPR